MQNAEQSACDVAYPNGCAQDALTDFINQGERIYAAFETEPNMQIDPFTLASPTYRAAMRHPHKSGSAFSGHFPRPSIVPPLLARAVWRGAAVLAVVGGVSWFLLWGV